MFYEYMIRKLKGEWIMRIRLILIKLLISSLWNSYYPVNILRMAFDDTLELLNNEGIKSFPISGFKTMNKLNGELRWKTILLKN